MAAKAGELQRELRENAEDYQSYLKSLYNWEEEIAIKDEALKKSVKKPCGQEFPIRQKVEPSKPLQQLVTEVNNDDSTSHQNKQQAVIEKNKGNDYFKEGSYAKAIESYSKAIELDPSDAILPANRAIAFLKMNKYAEAEEDCNKSLSLDPTFVKAYHRRGMARVSTGRIELAKKDFQKVLNLEPHNKAAQQELEKLVTKQLLESSSSSSTKDSSRPNKSAKKEVRFLAEPSEEVEQPAIKEAKVIRFEKPVQKPVEITLEHPALTQLEELLATCNSPPKNEPSSSVGIPVVAVSDMKQERLAIDRFISQLTVQKPENVATVIKTPSPTANAHNLTIPPAPKNYVQFDKDWKRLEQRADLQYQYLKQIPAAKLPDVFRESLESDILASLIAVLKSQCVQLHHEPLFPWLSSLSRVKRIAAVLMFLTSDQKSDLKDLIEQLSNNGEGTEEERKFITQKFLL